MCRQAQRDYKAGADLLAPVLAEREAEIEMAQRQARSPELPDDAIEWFRASAKGRVYNEVDLQMGLAVAAVHTTSDLLTQSLLNLCAHPEYCDQLRQEVVQVLGKYGWQKVALTELRLLDSFLKETQRLKPINMGESKQALIFTLSLRLTNIQLRCIGKHSSMSSCLAA